ncbi:MAG: hypothetical protein R2880_05380 [Deinococcales bacterium]
MSPLESFILDYLDRVGGAWERLEPQLYQALLPQVVLKRLKLFSVDEELLLSFDPEALADYPKAELIVFGNPLLDQILADAKSYGQSAEIYLSGFDLHPYKLEAMIEKIMGVRVLELKQRPLMCRYAWFWFEVSLTSDEKEQDLIPVILDMQLGDKANHLPEVLERFHQLDEPVYPYPDAPMLHLTELYERARQLASGSAMQLARRRKEELDLRADHEELRIKSYFEDLHEELSLRQGKAVQKGEDIAKYEQQALQLVLEEKVRLQDIADKRRLELNLKLINVLWIVQPKLALRLRIQEAKQQRELEALWDPATRKIDMQTRQTA